MKFEVVYIHEADGILMLNLPKDGPAFGFCHKDDIKAINEGKKEAKLLCVKDITKLEALSVFLQKHVTRLKEEAAAKATQAGSVPNQLSIPTKGTSNVGGRSTSSSTRPQPKGKKVRSVQSKRVPKSRKSSV